ncbi:MAG TPA: hypothetical protein VFB14_20245 [Bryobacteraceae bacterium]|jgi:hypothetical protein|nr:hypothetical protein [Bryobacteraceae bacterium]
MLKVSIAVLVLMAGICGAQNNVEKGLKHDRLDFVLKELDGNKVVNSRSYSVMVELEPTFRGPEYESIRAGNRVRINGAGDIDVGVNIDTRNAREVPSGLAVSVSASVSDLVPNTETAGAASVPALRQMKWSSDVIVPLRKPTTIFSSDDPTSKHKMQLELTATPIS